MINLISEIINNFVSILIFILLYLFFFKKFKKIQKILSIIILIIFFSPIANILVFSIERLNKRLDISDIGYNFDSIVILSGFEDVQKTKKFNQMYLGGSNNRVIEGTRVFMHYRKKIIFSGSSTIKETNIDPVYVAKLFFESVKISDENIIFDKNAKNTEDTFKFLNENFKDEKHLIVTSATHMQRCKYLLKKSGLNYILYPVDFRANHENIFKFSLDFANNVNLFQYGLREIAALIFYKISGRI